MAPFAAGSGGGSGQSKRTRLVQRTIHDLNNANSEFMSTGPYQDEVCVAVVPENNVCCFSFYLEVPSGPNVLWSNFGANQGKLEPGMKKCWPVWRTVSTLVSKQVITYNAVPKKCPTRDMIFVDVDLSINLRIGPDIARVQDFVHKMGPSRLDAYLHFEVEECMRALINNVTYDKVNDLRSDFSTEMLSTLQSKMAGYGVEIMNVKITDVQLPRELQQRLEKTTSFATRILEQEKNHSFSLQQLKNSHIQRMAAVSQDVTIQRQRIAAESARYEISQDEAMSVSVSDRKVRTERANGEKDVAVTKAKGAVEVAQYDGRANAESTISTMSIQMEQQLRAARLVATTTLKAADAQKNASTYLAQALLTEAKADGEAAAQLEEKVRFNHKMRLADIDSGFAKSGRKFLSGDDGSEIIKSFVMVRDELKT
mmetsp:Transcript_45358/g.58141  ORF Transcript_45358/g.58141 Transcript_45358/m.58141 type:complete len:426 (-) Transcript_45358:216-1493(-)